MDTGHVEACKGFLGLFPGAFKRYAFCDGVENLCYCAIENWVAVKKGRPKPSLTGPVRPVCRQFQ